MTDGAAPDVFEEAEKRARVHAEHVSQRILSPHNPDLVGLAGEVAFARWAGLVVDWEVRPGGDSGRDFQFGRWRLDVKTYRLVVGRVDARMNLIVENGKLDRADVFVCCRANIARRTARLMGWAFREDLAAVEPRDFGYGVLNHYVPVPQLRPMNTLAWTHEVAFGVGAAPACTSKARGER